MLGNDGRHLPMPSSTLSQKNEISSYSSSGEVTLRRKNLSSIPRNISSSKHLTPLPYLLTDDSWVVDILAKQMLS
jgi:hypothetical protein